ncbi:MAG: 2-polyprenyl-3-methyl-6-methoxy-1,4-benzoquinone monooxygenase [Burkholderiaceae bacterium]
MSIRRFNLTDRLISAAQRSVNVLAGSAQASRPNPADQSAAVDETSDEQLTESERRLSGSLMRVNHVGEICAQALYEGQGLMARSPDIRERLADAAVEERDHLAWTAQRLKELETPPSILNPVWYGASFAMGLVAGRLGDKASMGFMMETERQVEQHLDGHLTEMSSKDQRSRAIVAQMKQDEAQHGATARRMGGAPVPAPARVLMRTVAKVMTTTARYL